MKKLAIGVSFVILGFNSESQALATDPGHVAILPVKAEELARLKVKTQEQFLALGSAKDHTENNLVQRARLLYWVGQFAQSDDEKLSSFKEGMVILEPLMDQSQDPAPALLWAANAGGYASVKRDLAALKTLDKIEKVLLSVVSKYPAFESGAADRALASLYFSAPPIISIGSKKKATRHAQAAFSLNPHHPGNILIFAKVLSNQGEDEKARALYKEALLLANPETYPLDYALWRTEALEGLGVPQGLES